MKSKYRGISYSVVRTKADIWEWSACLGQPIMLKLGLASSESGAVTRARELIDEAMQESGLEAKRL